MLPFHHATGWLLLFLWSIPRIILVLQASCTGNFQLLSIYFLTMWIAPFVLLSKSDRRQMGIRWPASWIWISIAFISGFLCCLIMYLLANVLFAPGEEHWLHYLAGTYQQVPLPLADSDRVIYFAIFAAIGMTFSPIGEELFYRGMIHEHFRKKHGDLGASLVDSMAFSLVHLAHFGIICTAAGTYAFLPLPSLFWVLSLFALCLSFSYFRKKSDSILGAILSHAGFNFGMNYFIFYAIL